MNITISLEKDEERIDDLMLTIKWPIGDDESLIHFYMNEKNKLSIDVLDPGSLDLIQSIEDGND